MFNRNLKVPIIVFPFKHLDICQSLSALITTIQLSTISPPILFFTKKKKKFKARNSNHSNKQRLEPHKYVWQVCGRVIKMPLWMPASYLGLPQSGSWDHSQFHLLMWSPWEITGHDSGTRFSKWEIQHEFLDSGINFAHLDYWGYVQNKLTCEISLSLSKIKKK